MDSPDIRKIRCAEKIKQILADELCVLEASVAIVGTRIVDSQVIVLPMATPEKEEKPSVIPSSISTEEPVKEVNE